MATTVVRRYRLAILDDESVKGVMHKLCESLDIDFKVIIARADGGGSPLVEVSGSQAIIDVFDMRFDARYVHDRPPFRIGAHARRE